VSPPLPVSILVLVDDALEDSAVMPPPPVPGVSILVLVDDALEVRILPGSDRCIDVSILVLVDDALEVEFDSRAVYRIFCFNPCSRG